MPIEVSPIAHYHMGGVRADLAMETRVPNLFAAGELVAGANGANRLSGNAITEALVFGRRAGESAAARVKSSTSRAPASIGLDDALIRAESPESGANLANVIARLQDVMTDLVGPFRTRGGLEQALAQIAALKDEAGARPPGRSGPYPLQRIDWFDLRAMLMTAEAITRAALLRTESRGAHQREDFPGLDAGWTLHQAIACRDGALTLSRVPVEGALSEVA
jgi:succinate dehydrogenase / fumarate reductase flavoprotein subunit/fumarate reductase (CoM/CoB) subunit A